MNVVYVLIALLFIISPIATGFFFALWYMRKREILRLRIELAEMRAEQRKILYLYPPGKPEQKEEVASDEKRKVTPVSGRPQMEGKTSGKVEVIL
jgi:hypothetical protein